MSERKKAERLVIKARITEAPIYGTLQYWGLAGRKQTDGYIWTDGNGGVFLRKSNTRYSELIALMSDVIDFTVVRLSHGYVLEANEKGDLIGRWVELDHSQLHA